MPTHRTHRTLAELLGFDVKVASKVDRFLDFPPRPLGHKALHNPMGLALTYKRYGRSGAIYAASHIFADYLTEEAGRQLKKALKRKNR